MRLATTNGIALATIIVTAIDGYNNPIQGAAVQIQATGSTSVTQTSALTDSLGKAKATVKETVIETINISAEINSVPSCRVLTFASIVMQPMI